jgi:hypothetical protein
MDEKKVIELMVTHLEKRFPVIMGYKSSAGRYNFTYYGEDGLLVIEEQMRAFLMTYFNRRLSLACWYAQPTEENVYLT